MQQPAATGYFLVLADQVDLQESLLDRILGVRAMAQNPACEPQARRAVIGHEAVPVEHSTLHGWG